MDYGTAPGALTLNVSNATLVTAHSLPLSGLTPGTTYYYHVVASNGVDAATADVLALTAPAAPAAGGGAPSAPSGPSTPCR